MAFVGGEIVQIDESHVLGNTQIPMELCENMVGEISSVSSDDDMMQSMVDEQSTQIRELENELATYKDRTLKNNRKDLPWALGLIKLVEKDLSKPNVNIKQTLNNLYMSIDELETEIRCRK